MMGIVLMVLFTTAQVEDSQWMCGGTEAVRNCHGPDGSSYIERRIGSRLVRKGTTPDGQVWTEYITKNFDGWRLQGEDSTGGRWFQLCNPRSGIHGTNRFGKAVSLPVGTDGCRY